VDELRKEIDQCASGNRNPAVVETFLKNLSGGSGAAHVKCASGSQKAIKGSHLKKHIVAEHVVGRIGQLLGAPVGTVGFAEIPDELRKLQPELQRFGPGLAHAIDWIPDCGDKMALQYAANDYNRSRFAAILVLYALAYADDPQVIYKTMNPCLAYSVDHGHFLAGGGGSWSEASLRGAPAAALHAWHAQISPTTAELAPVKANLAAITDDDFAKIVLGPPDAWGVAKPERDALKDYFVKRRDEILKLLPD
jgi:hypothetical protein